MSAAISRSERSGARPPEEPPRRWADGAAELTFAHDDGRTVLRHLYQSDPCRVLFPNTLPGEPPCAVVVTTSGGLVGGDRLRFDIRAERNATATVTTQAAEKVYRSAGGDTEIAVRLAVAGGALLEWMPQETILFDGARLRRAVQVDVARGGRLIAGEIAVFGRRARGESFDVGLFHDAWRISVDGTLVWADAMHLAGDIREILERPAAFDGAAAVASLVYVADDARDRVELARALLKEAPGAVRCGATCIGPMLLVRFLDRDAAAVRRAYGDFWALFRAASSDLPARLPRIWEV